MATRNTQIQLKGTVSLYRDFIIFSIVLKGQSNEIFDLWFFPSLKLVWATDQQVKIFSIFDKNSPSYTNFKFENMTPRGMIPRQVNLPGV